MPMLQQTTGDVRLADHKRRHQRGGVPVLAAIPTNFWRIPSRTVLNIASAGYPNYCLLTNCVHLGDVGWTTTPPPTKRTVGVPQSSTDRPYYRLPDSIRSSLNHDNGVGG